nr:hypothetical protein [Allomuricauda sp.]
MGQGFSLHRVVQFIKRDLVLLRGTFTTGFFVAVILIFLFCLFNMIWDKQLSTDEFHGIFGLIYIPVGLLFTFAMFREYSNPKTNHFYLALPVSIPERLVAKWVMGVGLYTVVFSVLALITASLAMIFGIVLFGAQFHMLSIFSLSYIKVVATYMFLQPVFMVGALTFSKNRMGKTLLILALTVLCFVLFNVALYAMFNRGLGVFSEDGLGSTAFSKAGEDFSWFGKWFYGFIFGPLMLVVAYFKMVEKEV